MSHVGSRPGKPADHARQGPRSSDGEDLCVVSQGKGPPNSAWSRPRYRARLRGWLGLRLR